MRIFQILTIAAYFLSFAPAQAATFSLVEDTVMGCFLRLEGLIEKGDAEVLERYVRTEVEKIETGEGKYWDDVPPEEARYHSRICLNSPGGSLSEAIKMGKALNHYHLGTAIGPSQRCESACAIVFMGGSHRVRNTDIGAVNVDRILHPSGRLGFHSPSLIIPNGTYSERTVGKAYNVALESVAEILANAKALDIRTSLLVTMLGTPAQDMLYVETVGQAVEWNITIAPATRPAPLRMASAIQGCNNAIALWSGTSPQTLSERVAIGAFFDRPYLPEISRENGKISIYSEMGYGNVYAGPCDITIEDPGHGAPTAAAGYGALDHVWGVFYDYLFFSPEAKISSLARRNDMAQEDIPFTFAPVQSTFPAQCLVFDANYNMTDSEPCRAERSQLRDASATKFITDIFHWPSGSKTRVETSIPVELDTYIPSRINGAQTTRFGYYSNLENAVRSIFDRVEQEVGEASRETRCWRNPQSKNYFCMVPLVEDTDFFFADLYQ